MLQSSPRDQAEDSSNWDYFLVYLFPCSILLPSFSLSAYAPKFLSFLIGNMTPDRTLASFDYQEPFGRDSAWYETWSIKSKIKVKHRYS